MELHFDAILFSKLRDENSDADHIKCSRRPQVPHSGPNQQVHSHYVRWTVWLLAAIAVFPTTQKNHAE